MINPDLSDDSSMAVKREESSSELLIKENLPAQANLLVVRSRTQYRETMWLMKTGITQPIKLYQPGLVAMLLHVEQRQGGDALQNGQTNVSEHRPICSVLCSILCVAAADIQHQLFHILEPDRPRRSV